MAHYHKLIKKEKENLEIVGTQMNINESQKERELESLMRL